MRIVMLGAPGSGKGTQARLLSDHYKAPHISTGDLLRDAIEAGTKIGKEAEQAVDGGDLVPNDLVIRLIEERLQMPDARRGFILDGFPRNIPQAQELDNRLGWMGRPLQIALNVSVDVNTLMKRLTGRLTCGECGAIYNEHFSRPKKPGVCDQCGAKKLQRRADDNEKTVSNRLAVYEQETAPLTAYYKAQQKLRSVVADGKSQLIFEKICDIIDADIRPLEVRLVETDARPATASAAATTVSTIAGGEVHKHTVIEKRPPPKKAVAAVLRVPSEAPAKASAAPKPAKDSASGSAARAKAQSGGRKVAAGAAGKSAKKSAKKAARKAAKKSTKPAVKKAMKKAVKKATKKVAKKAAKKIGKKVAKKTAKKKVAKKAAQKKVAKKAAKKKVTKSARKTASKVAPRSTNRPTAKKKPAAKARKGKNIKRTTKKKVTTKRKVAKKPQAKMAKKTSRKKTQKTARQAGKKVGKKTGKRSARIKTAAKMSNNKSKARRR